MYRVMIVGSDPGLRAELRQCFPIGDDSLRLCAEAFDAELGIGIARDVLPDLILADADMLLPDIESFSRAVCTDLPWIRIIRVTASDTPAARTPDCAYLLRPVHPEQLRTTLLRQGALAERSIAGVHARLLEARSEADDPRCVLYGGSVPKGATLTRSLRIYASPSEIPTIFALLRSPDPAARLGSCIQLTRGVSCITVAVPGNDPLSLEELVYRCAYAARQIIRVYLGIEVQIVIGDTVSGFDPEGFSMPMRPVYSRPILGTGDAVLACPGRAQPPTLLGELLPAASEKALPALLAYCERLACLSPQHVSAAARGLLLEATGTMPPAADWPEPHDRVETLALLARAVRTRDSVAPGLSDHFLSRTRAFIAEEIGNPSLSAINIARTEGVSRSRLRLVLSQELGMTVSAYLLRLRCDTAEQQLLHTRKRLSTISASVGFPDPVFFTDLYRRTYGRDPRALRSRPGKG